jgi:hypothetical protein
VEKKSTIICAEPDSLSSPLYHAIQGIVRGTGLQNRKYTFKMPWLPRIGRFFMTKYFFENHLPLPKT